jgi:hypothetical protein
MGVPSWMSLGFLRPRPELDWGSSRRAFGTPGAGGSFGFADPDARLGFAYVMNNMDFYMFDDPREKALRDAVYRSIRRALRLKPPGQRPRELLEIRRRAHALLRRGRAPPPPSRAVRPGLGDRVWRAGSRRR